MSMFKTWLSSATLHNMVHDWDQVVCSSENCFIACDMDERKLIVFRYWPSSARRLIVALKNYILDKCGGLKAFNRLLQLWETFRVKIQWLLDFEPWWHFQHISGLKNYFKGQKKRNKNEKQLLLSGERRYGYKCGYTGLLCSIMKTRWFMAYVSEWY